MRMMYDFQPSLVPRNAALVLQSSPGRNLSLRLKGELRADRQTNYLYIEYEIDSNLRRA